MANFDDFTLSEVELDAIGEVMNISMGSAATAMSTILDRKVSITTPNIRNVAVDDFNFEFLHPVVGVEIKYVEGIDGANVLLLRQSDVAKIVAHLLAADPEEMTELDEIGQSAICEIMNQMMGSAASALATFLGRPINISPPEVLSNVEHESVREMFEIKGDSVVSIKFNLSIEGLVESEFLSALEPKLAKEIVSISFGFNGFGHDSPAGDSAADEADQTAAAAASAAPGIPAEPGGSDQGAPQTPMNAGAGPQNGGAVPYQDPAQGMYPGYGDMAAAGMPGGSGMPGGAYMENQSVPGAYAPNAQQAGMAGADQAAMAYQNAYPYPGTGAGYQPVQQAGYGSPPQAYGQAPPGYYPYPPQPYMAQQQPIYPQDRVATTTYSYKTLGGQSTTIDQDNLDLVMTVPIQISVELGRTRRKIKDIADLGIGNIVELDRQAGDQVDVIANGKLIARGDVVVVDDNYSVRITEIIKQPEEFV